MACLGEDLANVKSKWLCFPSSRITKKNHKKNLKKNLGVLTKLATVRFLLHVKYTLSYRIVIGLRCKAAIEIHSHSHSSISIPILLFPLPQYSHCHSHSGGNLTVHIPMHISSQRLSGVFLDCCNAVLAKSITDKLQRVLNAAARLVCQTAFCHNLLDSDLH